MQDPAVDLHPGITALGPDPLSPEFSSDEALSRLRARPAVEIAEALSDQRVMAGVGNVYKSEILFVESVNPWARVAELDELKLGALIATARRLLVQNAAPGHLGGGAPLDDSAAYAAGRTGPRKF